MIEGADGSGKATQVKVLAERLKEFGMEVSVYDFPQYDETFFGRKMGEYLTGKYGEMSEVHPFLAALLPALDRFQVVGRIRKDLEEGKFVLCNRYMTANLGHGAAKFEDPKEREEFIKDMEEVEYGILGLPRPDLVLYLFVPVEVSQELLECKAERNYVGGKKKDIAEKDIEHQKKAIEAFKWLVEHREGIVEINCTDEKGGLLAVETIHQKIWQELSERGIV